MMRWSERGILNINQKLEEGEKTWREMINVCVGTSGFVRGHHGHCTRLCLCERVCSVFVSLPLCRLAKPPVPQLHLWSPGKWLIWKYNHSGQDFISSSPTLSLSLFITLISFPTNKISVSRLSLSVPLAPSLTSKQLTLPFCCLTQLS